MLGSAGHYSVIENLPVSSNSKYGVWAIQELPVWRYYSNTVNIWVGGRVGGWNLNKRVGDCKKLSSEGKVVIINLDYNHQVLSAHLTRERNSIS